MIIHMPHSAKRLGMSKIPNIIEKKWRPLVEQAAELRGGTRPGPNSGPLMPPPLPLLMLHHLSRETSVLVINTFLYSLTCCTYRRSNVEMPFSITSGTSRSATRPWSPIISSARIAVRCSFRASITISILSTSTVASVSCGQTLTCGCCSASSISKITPRPCWP